MLDANEWCSRIWWNFG